MVDQRYIIYKEETLMNALRRINDIGEGPLVLFVVDSKNKMVGTLTDGDYRRAIIAGCSVNEPVKKAMHCNFNALTEGVDYDVKHLHTLKEMKMHLVPVLDKERRIIEIINLERYRTKLPIDAVIMAGGRGERLRPFTDKTPKPLLLVGDKAIIDHNIDRLILYGVQHISVTVNYLKEIIEEHYREPHDGVQIQTIREPMFLGTIGSIKFIPKFYNDTVLLMNSDVFTNIDYEDFFLHFQQYDADMSVAAVPYNVSIPYGILDLDGRDIKGLLEKPKYTYYINAGIYMMKSRVLEEIPYNKFYNATDLVDKLISKNMRVIRYPLNGTWIDIGNPQEYQKANDFAKHLRI